MQETEVVFEANADDFATKVLATSLLRPVVVDFWAPWCGPCLALGPILERVVRSFGGRAALAKVNIDQNPSLAMQYGVRSIPAVKVFKKGHVVAEFVGALPESEVRRQLSAVIPSEADDLVAEADELAAQGQWEKAKEKYEQALAAQPNHPRAALRLAEAALREGDFQRALQLAEKVEERAPERELAEKVACRAWFAQRCAEAGDRAACEQQAAEQPENLEARFALACRLVLDGEYERALEEFLALVKADRDFRSGEPREAMVRIFALVGQNSELANKYRRLLASQLYK